MKCDKCKKDADFFSLIWNGRYIHNDTLFTIRKRKMTVCNECFDNHDYKRTDQAVL